MNVCVENDRFQVLCCLFLTYGQYSILNTYAIYLLLKTSFFQSTMKLRELYNIFTYSVLFFVLIREVYVYWIESSILIFEERFSPIV
jgi:hypothetical protein